MPEAATLPAIHNNAGLDDVDVLDFLGLKRAKTIKSSTSGESQP